MYDNNIKEIYFKTTILTYIYYNIVFNIYIVLN